MQFRLTLAVPLICSLIVPMTTWKPTLDAFVGTSALPVVDVNGTIVNPLSDFPNLPAELATDKTPVSQFLSDLRRADSRCRF